MFLARLFISSTFNCINLSTLNVSTANEPMVFPYIIAVFIVYPFKPVPFMCSFATSFIVLHIIEAVILNKIKSYIIKRRSLASVIFRIIINYPRAPAARNETKRYLYGLPYPGRASASQLTLGLN